MRHGVGNCSWPDGSRYRGDWVQNVRHGNGVFTLADGTTYEGEWVNDVKHGKGMLKYPNGETIIGYWQNDRLNGLAKVKKQGQAEPDQVIYKNDMLIMTNNTGVNGAECFYVIFSIFLMLAVYASIPLGILLGPPYFGIAGVYLIYVIYSCCTSSTKYIKNVVTNA